MKVIAVIPVKYHSTRVKSKNTRLLCDKPLFIHTLDKLLNIKEIDEVWIDTDNKSVIDLALDYNCKNFKYFIRDDKLSSNNTCGNKLLENEINNISSDIYLQVLCTSPFLKEETIIKSIKILKEKTHTSVITIFKEKIYKWHKNEPCYNINSIPNSVDLDNTIKESMSFYGITKQEFIKSKNRIGTNPYLLEIDLEESIDINYENDFNLANKISKINFIEECYSLSLLKLSLNSCILSDILNDMGYSNCVLKNFKLNIEGKKLFGRVRPIQIRPLNKDEDPNDIYKCLESYNNVSPYNIIFVNNKVENRAYFGDLNATISISKNAQGTIVNGFTRDISRTISLDYPVFYKNNTCSDVKKYGTLDYYDKPIFVEDIKIYVNNLIFADMDGVVIIPKSLENTVLQKCKEIIICEGNIANSIIIGKTSNEVINKYGFF